jgi:predicted transposase YdaD
MQYDIASKVVINMAKEAILRRFLSLDPAIIEFIEELPQETTSLRRSDFPLHVILKDGKEVIVLIEIQTDFEKDFALRLLEYTVRFKLKYGLEVIPFVMVFTPSKQATGFYEDNILTFKYQVLRFWELKSEDYNDEIWLYPFLPLMQDGEQLITKAETAIYKSKDISDDDKADLLTAMAIFAGFKDKDIASQLIRRRRDLMMRSPTYDILIEEIEKEKKDEWRSEGLQQGLQQGIQQGSLRESRGLIFELLDERFGEVPKSVASVLDKIDDVKVLRSLHRLAIHCSSIEEFKKAIDKYK